MNGRFSKKKSSKKKAKTSKKPKTIKIDWLAINWPFNQSQRLKAFGMMWAEIARIIPENKEERIALEESMAVATGKKLEDLKKENQSNSFIIGKHEDEYVLGLYYRKASTMSLISKLEVLVFYCQDDYSEGGLGDILMDYLLNGLGITVFEGKAIEFNIKARSEKLGFVKFLTERHGFELDLGTPKETRPGWYTKVVEY